MGAQDALAEAERLVRQAPSGTEGLWSRAAALLARQALESAIRVRISRRVHRPEEVSFTAQLLCLHDFTDPGTADRAAFVWDALSAATHHHGYELPPSASSIDAWLVTVRQVIEQLEACAPR